MAVSDNEAGKVERGPTATRDPRFLHRFRNNMPKTLKGTQKTKNKTKKPKLRAKRFSKVMAKTHLYAQFCFFGLFGFLVPYSVFACIEENIAKHMTSACALEQGRRIRLGMAVRDN